MFGMIFRTAKEPNLEAGFGITFAQSIEKERQNILSLGMLLKLTRLAGDTTTKSNSMAAHFHSLTTDSYGVLSDVRTGGLKRDLSAAFAVDSERLWEKDFQGLFISGQNLLYEKPVFQVQRFCKSMERPIIGSIFTLY